MIDALSIASSGLTANQSWIDTISNNVANMQTVGFKRSQVNFQDLIGRSELDQAGAPVAMGAGVASAEPTTVFGVGSIKSTNNPWDIAIQGKGFLEVTTPTGDLAYTRIGRFHVTESGQLALPDGQLLTSDVRVPSDAENIMIQADGNITATVANTGEKLVLGQLQLAHFASEESLTQIGSGLYQPTTHSGSVEYAAPRSNGVGGVLQGHVEMSNVDLVEEMTSLVMAQRAYQMNARLLQASDQVMETVNNLKR